MQVDTHIVCSSTAIPIEKRISLGKKESPSGVKGADQVLSKNDLSSIRQCFNKKISCRNTEMFQARVDQTTVKESRGYCSRRHCAASGKRRRRGICCGRRARRRRRPTIFRHRRSRTGVTLAAILVPPGERGDPRKRCRRKCQKERLPLHPDPWSRVTMASAKASRTVA